LNIFPIHVWDAAESTSTPQISHSRPTGLWSPYLLTNKQNITQNNQYYPRISSQNSSGSISHYPYPPLSSAFALRQPNHPSLLCINTDSQLFDIYHLISSTPNSCFIGILQCPSFHSLKSNLQYIPKLDLFFPGNSSHPISGLIS